MATFSATWKSNMPTQREIGAVLEGVSKSGPGMNGAGGEHLVGNPGPVELGS